MTITDIIDQIQYDPDGPVHGLTEVVTGLVDYAIINIAALIPNFYL